MATSQFAFQSGLDARKLAPLPAIDLEHVSVSQLLGRDYIFIDAQGTSLPLDNPNLLYPLLDELIARLELAETHTVAVSALELSDGTASFTRHDLTWDKHKISHVESIQITQAEQQEFMDMIWRCSTSALTV
jgi:hypothetical protein